MKGFKITTAEDVRNPLKVYRDTYHEKGKWLGWEKLNDHYTMMLGTCTDWTGFPRSGKTQVLMELLLNTSMWYGWKHLVYFPDVGNNVEIISDLLHKKTGKTFNPDYDNVISDDEIDRELEWITDHFYILTKEDVKGTMTPFEFWDYAVQLKNERGLQTACIDSWKDMSHPYAKYGGYATYLEVVLPYRNQIAEDHNLHLHTIIHPKLTEKENGKRPAPSPYDLKGGSEWFNSGKCMITVHREDVTDNRVEIYFHKMKPRAVGNLGMIELRFDMKTFTYYDLETLAPNEYVKHYAAPNGTEIKEQVKFNGIKPNNSFDVPTMEDFSKLEDEEELPF